MYVPEYSRQKDPEQIRELIREYPFATVITNLGGDLNIGHLPVLLDESDPAKRRLIGHLARANPQARDFEAGREAFVIFHGPNAYVSPRWYAGKLNVPTWNYAVVHVRGASRACGGEKLIEILDRSTTQFEAGSENPWTFSGNPDLPQDFSRRLLDAIVGFEIEMTQVEAKFKLSQNRDADDYRGARKGLGAQNDEMSQAIFSLMKPRS